jgi:hypothetical protein
MWASALVAAAAFERVAGRGKRGKVVLEVGTD